MIDGSTLRWMMGILPLMILLNSLFGFSLYGQQKNKPIKDINIILECVKFIGNDKYVATFGYDNPNNFEISVPEPNSILIKNEGESTNPTLNYFASGRNDMAFTREFSSNDRIMWRMVLPNGKIKEVTASANSNQCPGIDTTGMDILPYYDPPLSGKNLSLIGPELTSLHQNYRLTGIAVSDFVFQTDGINVLVEVVANAGQYDNLLQKLVLNYNFILLHGDPVTLVITGLVPIELLDQLNELIAELNFARPVYPPLLKNSGLALNNGDYSIKSNVVRSGYGLTGSGVKVGIISDSYNTQGGAGNDVINGDLPGVGNIDGNVIPVHVLTDYTLPFGALSDEGRAMLQIVHDLAPGSELAFRSGYICPGDFADGIRELAQANCGIIVDDLSYITESFFSDGVVSQAVDEVVGQGVTYFSAAGNFGQKAHESIFKRNKGKNPRIVSGDFHDFGSGDIYQNISLEKGDYVVVLQWEENGIVDNDLDIYLSNEDGTTLFGFNRNNIGGDAVEILPFKVVSETANSNFIIVRADGTENVKFKYVVFRGKITINEYNTGTSTIVGQSNSVGAITVGAVKYDNTPVFGVDPPTIASFSSSGGTAVNGLIRQKPDITAPNGVNTTVALSPYDLDDDGNYEFYGTSAAAQPAEAMTA